jgi:hypothetical protein
MRKAAQEGVTRWRSLRELYGTHVWQGEGWVAFFSFKLLNKGSSLSLDLLKCANVVF